MDNTVVVIRRRGKGYEVDDGLMPRRIYVYPSARRPLRRAKEILEAEPEVIDLTALAKDPSADRMDKLADMHRSMLQDVRGAGPDIPAASQEPADASPQDWQKQFAQNLSAIAQRIEPKLSQAENPATES